MATPVQVKVSKTVSDAMMLSHLNISDAWSWLRSYPRESVVRSEQWTVKPVTGSLKSSIRSMSDMAAGPGDS
eukprot:2059660-Amphidinium_carterae.2